MEREYFDESMFTDAGITPEWVSYQGYPEYPQLHGSFEHAVTALDLLFNTVRMRRAILTIRSDEAARVAAMPQLA